MSFPKYALPVALACAACAAPPVPPRPMLDVNVGLVNLRKAERPVRVGVNYRFRPVDPVAQVIPTLGMAVADNGAAFGHFELLRDFWISSHWVLTPSLGIGGFVGKDDFDLGGVFEFREGIELAWRFDNDSRVGLRAFHLSNAGIHDRNPGTEALVLSYEVPIGLLP